MSPRDEPDSRPVPSAEGPLPRDVPRGLVFFSAATPAPVRRRRFGFVVLLALAALAVTWPGYRWFSGAFPLVLGLPQSLAWVILWLAVIFFGLLGLYLGDRKAGEPRPRGGGP